MYKIIGAKGPCELSGLGKNLTVICIFGNAKFPLSKWMGLCLWILSAWILSAWGQGSWRFQADKPAVCDYSHKGRCLGHGTQRSDNSLQLCFRLLGCWKARHLESFCLKLVISVLHSTGLGFCFHCKRSCHANHSFYRKIFWGDHKTCKEYIRDSHEKMLNNPLRMCWIHVHMCAYMQNHR